MPGQRCEAASHKDLSVSLLNQRIDPIVRTRIEVRIQSAIDVKSCQSIARLASEYSKFSPHHHATVRLHYHGIEVRVRAWIETRV